MRLRRRGGLDEGEDEEVPAVLRWRLP